MKGSIWLRGNTYTAYWFCEDPATGDYRQHTKGGFPTKKAAQSHLNGILKEVEDGQWTPDSKLTVRQLIEDHWLPAKEAEGKAPATVSQYRDVAKAWVIPRIVGMQVRQVTPRTAGKLVAEARAAGVSWSAIGAALDTTRQAAYQRFGQGQREPAG